MDAFRVSLRPREVRHQVRPREHPNAGTGARAASQPISQHPDRRHERQRLRDGDGRPRAPQRGTARRTVYLASSRQSRRTLRDRRRAGFDGRARFASSKSVRGRHRHAARQAESSRRRQRSSRSPRRSRSSCSRAPASTSRCSRSVWAAASTRRISSNLSRQPITSIDFDHEQYLGNTLAAIAAEKAGVIRAEFPWSPVRFSREARDVLVSACASIGADFIDADAGVAIDSTIAEGRTSAAHHNAGPRLRMGAARTSRRSSGAQCRRRRPTARGARADRCRSPLTPFELAFAMCDGRDACR